VLLGICIGSFYIPEHDIYHICKYICDMMAIKKNYLDGVVYVERSKFDVYY